MNLTEANVALSLQNNITCIDVQTYVHVHKKDNTCLKKKPFPSTERNNFSTEKADTMMARVPCRDKAAILILVRIGQ